MPLSTLNINPVRICCRIFCIQTRRTNDVCPTRRTLVASGALARAYSAWHLALIRSGARELRKCELPCGSPRQDDFAKWPILNQMAQRFARLVEGIDPPDDRLN
jgi:hypothetical protein